MTANFRYSFTFVFILFLSFSALGQNHSSQLYSDSTWSKPYKPFRIAGNLYYVGTYDLACYLVVTPKGNVLINSGLAGSVPMIQKSIEALGFKFTAIKILLTTQVHYDHVSGLAEIKKVTGAKMMVNEADAQVLADGGNSDFIYGGKGALFNPVKADRLLKDGDTLQIGDTKIIVLHHPGHTKGATSFLIDVKDSTRSWRVLIANMPTILSETKLAGMPSYPGVGKDYQYTLTSLKNLQFDLWVTSHASQFGLHKKRKEDDPYRPQLFNDRAAYDAAIADLQLEYDKRLQLEK